MSAYNNDLARKTVMVTAMQLHRELDHIRQGATGQDGAHGCTVSCAYQTVKKTWDGSYDHQGLAAHLGVEWTIPRLADRLFEGLPAAESQAFAVDWLDAIVVGSDTSSVIPHMQAFFSRRAQAGFDSIVATLDELLTMIPESTSYRAEVLGCIAAARDVAALATARTAGTAVDSDAWRRAAGVARRAHAALWAALPSRIRLAAEAEAVAAEAEAAAVAVEAVAAAVAAAAEAAEAAAEAAAVAVAAEAAVAANRIRAGATITWGEFWNIYHEAYRTPRQAFYREAAAEFITALKACSTAELATA